MNCVQHGEQILRQCLRVVPTSRASAPTATSQVDGDDAARALELWCDGRPDRARVREPVHEQHRRTATADRELDLGALRRDALDTFTHTTSPVTDGYHDAMSPAGKSGDALPPPVVTYE